MMTMARILLLLVIYLLSSCSGLTPTMTMSQLNKWVHDNIEYRPDEKSEVASPQETLNRGYGDCEDMALLLMQGYYEATGNKAIFVGVVTKNGTNHAVVEWAGVWYDPTTGMEYSVNRWPVIGKVSYDWSMISAVFY